MRLVWIFLVLAVLVIVPFLIWGEWFEKSFDVAATRTWLQQLGPWGWLAALALLVGDLILPVPATPVMSALGWVYGLAVGGLVGAAGSFLSGATAYLLCRGIGENAARRILGPDDLEKGRRLFSNSGGWIIVLSRWLPILPEITSCMAGLTRMPPGRFFSSLACGCIPMAFAFAWIGSRGEDSPTLAIGLSILLPVLFWSLATLVIRRRNRQTP